MAMDQKISRSASPSLDCRSCPVISCLARLLVVLVVLFLSWGENALDYMTLSYSPKLLNVILSISFLTSYISNFSQTQFLEATTIKQVHNLNEKHYIKLLKLVSGNKDYIFMQIIFILLPTFHQLCRLLQGSKKW